MTSDTAHGLVTISRLGRFDVVDRLGAGGMAEVLLAFRRSEGFSRAVALKRVLPQFAAQPRRQGQDHAIGADPEATVAEPLHPLGRQSKRVF